MDKTFIKTQQSMALNKMGLFWLVHIHFLWLVGNTWHCSGFTPCSVLRSHSCLGDHIWCPGYNWVCYMQGNHLIPVPSLSYFFSFHCHIIWFSFFLWMFFQFSLESITIISSNRSLRFTLPFFLLLQSTFSLHINHIQDHGSKYHEIYIVQYSNDPQMCIYNKIFP